MLAGSSNAVSSDGTTRALAKGDSVFEGETIKTGTTCYVKIKYTDGGMMLLRPKTELRIEKYAGPETGATQSVTELLKGGMRSVTGTVTEKDKAAYKVKSQVAVLGIRGTDYTLRLCQNDCADLQHEGKPAPANGLYALTHEGVTILNNNAGALESTKGEATFVAGYNLPPQRLKEPPQIIVADALPSPLDDTAEFIEGNECGAP